MISFFNKEERNYKKLINKKREYDELTKIVYNNSGDMNGNINMHEFNVKTLEITKEYRTEMGEDIKVTKYKFNNDNIKIIKEYIEKYNFPMWNNLEFDESEFVLDDASTTMTFYYDNTKKGGKSFNTYTINYNYKIPKKGRENLNEFQKYLFSLETEDNKKEEKYIKE